MVTILSAGTDLGEEALAAELGRTEANLHRRLSALMVALPVIIIVFEGWARRWVADDAYIDFRVVANLTSGYGPVYNRGERLEVYTDPLWVGILSVFHWISFMPIQWCAVLLGLGLTAAGVALGGRAGQAVSKLVDGWEGGQPKRPIPVVPAGMLMFVSLDAAWDFSSSGLETGLIFGWLGASFAALVRIACRAEVSRRSMHATAVLIGLGPLVRPDMALFAGPLLIALCALATDKKALAPFARSSAPLLGSAVALSGFYELWRMAYFALLLPNTALVKSAGSAWWLQGLTYLRDTVDPYLLWIPLLIGLAVVSRRVSRLKESGNGRLALVVAAPVVGALLDGFYVIRIGGDFMHGRMLLPAIFAVGLSFWVPLRSTAEIAAAGSVAVWSVAAIAVLHYPQRADFPNGIANERAFYVAQSGNPHPVTPDEYATGTFAVAGENIAAVARQPIPPSSSVFILGSAQGDVSAATVVPRTMPAKVLAPVANIGIAGVAAGQDVYVYDELSLANPVGGHLSESAHIRPGHSQEAPVVWFQGRFLPATDDYLVDPPSDLTGGRGRQSPVDAARAALSCGELGRYLAAIDGHLTFAKMVSNVVDSVGFTTFTISPDPYLAERQECGGPK